MPSPPGVEYLYNSDTEVPSAEAPRTKVPESRYRSADVGVPTSGVPESRARGPDPDVPESRSRVPVPRYRIPGCRVLRYR